MNKYLAVFFVYVSVCGRKGIQEVFFYMFALVERNATAPFSLCLKISQYGIFTIGFILALPPPML